MNPLVGNSCYIFNDPFGGLWWMNYVCQIAEWRRVYPRVGGGAAGVAGRGNACFRR